jgi:hypothetical protein
MIKGMVREFVQRVINGSTLSGMVHLLGDHKISESELKEISRMLERKK